MDGKNGNLVSVVFTTEELSVLVRSIGEEIGRMQENGRRSRGNIAMDNEIVVATRLGKKLRDGLDGYDEKRNRYAGK